MFTRETSRYFKLNYLVTIVGSEKALLSLGCGFDSQLEWIFLTALFRELLAFTFFVFSLSLIFLYLFLRYHTEIPVQKP